MSSDPGGDGKRAPRRDLWRRGRGGAAGRLAAGLVVPDGAPGFDLTPEARVFALGGGFARRLATALAGRGVRVQGRSAPLAGAGPDPAARDNPPLIRQELEWAAGHRFAEEALLPLADGWMDPFLPGLPPPVARAEIRGRRAALARHFAGAFRSDLVVLLPGAAEVWYDRRSKLALAGPPHRLVYEGDRSRFGVKRLSAEEVTLALRGACEVLRARAPQIRVALGVSPLPMERTYLGEDIIVANMAAKSTLHAAATALAREHDWIGYFPAYEAATASDPATVWDAERRALTPAMLDRLAEAFLGQFGLMLSAESRTAGRA